MDYYFGETSDSFEYDQQYESGIVLSIDTQREMAVSNEPMVGTSWSKEVFDYMQANMDSSRIGKFLEDSFMASTEKYLNEYFKRNFFN